MQAMMVMAFDMVGTRKMPIYGLFACICLWNQNKISNVMNLFTEKTIKPVILYMNRVFDGGSNEKK